VVGIDGVEELLSEGLTQGLTQQPSQQTKFELVHTELKGKRSNHSSLMLRLFDCIS